MSALEHPAIVLFSKLLSAPSPSGREEQVADLVRAELDELNIVHTTDPAGNVLVRADGSNRDGPLCCLAAHMDEIGMVVTNIQDDGSLLVDRSGGLYPWKLGEGPVEILGDKNAITGILSMGSTHTPDAGNTAITWSDVRILTGLSPTQLDDAGIRPGSTAVPARSVCGPIAFGDPNDPLVAAWTFDDRMGVVALLRLLEQLQTNALQPVNPLLVAFTVHEEGGGHGAKVLAHREKPELFISVDGCPIPPSAPLTLDGRPGIWSKDRLVHYDQELLRFLMDAAHTAGTELQPVVYDGAASDASLVYSTGGAPRVACFGQVRDNSHGYEVARLSVFDNMLSVLVEFVTTWE